MAKKRTVFNQLMDSEMERKGVIVPVGRVHTEMEARLAAIAEHEQKHDGEGEDCPYCKRDRCIRTARVAAEKPIRF